MSAATSREPIPPHRAAADAAQIAAYRRMTPGRRLELAATMHAEARTLLDAGLQLSHPHLSPEARQREVARRLLHAHS